MQMRGNGVRSAIGAAVIGLAAAFAGPATSAQEVKVIELTQIACQFVESENGVDHGFTTSKKADCEASSSSGKWQDSARRR